MARRRISGRELAKRISKNPQWVTTRMNGQTSITIEDIPLIAAGLGMTPQELGHKLVDQLEPVDLPDGSGDE